MAEGQKKYEKPKNRKGTILRLGSYMIQYKYLVLLALGLTIGSNLLALVGPMLSGYAIDAIEPGVGKVDFARVFYYAGLMVVFYVVSSILSYILAVLMIHISRKVVYQMRKDVFTHLMELPVGYFDTHQTGDIISRISYDIDTVNTSLANDLIQILTTLITVVGAFVMMIVISPKLILIFVFTVPLSVILTKLITGK
ncbi:MAG: ABC transporter ATP-binding protein, partial [Lachnospiraceae bacterium]|nr:ABC transporter ATP-binding protein [Lachnospiraceae bacterium]